MVSKQIKRVNNTYCLTCIISEKDFPKKQFTKLIQNGKELAISLPNHPTSVLAENRVAYWQE